MDKKEVIIMSVPYCEPFPMTAPVLLAGCLEDKGIPSKGIDFNIKFIDRFHKEEWFMDFKNFLTLGHLRKSSFNKKIFKSVYKFTKNFLLECKKEYDPEWIGLSIFTSESLDYGLILSYLIRKYLPNVKIIAGGKGLEVADGKNKHYETWIRYGIVDTIIYGDAESAIIEAIKENKFGLIQAKQQTKEDLDAIPLSKWEDYDLSIYKSFINLLDVDKTMDQVMEPYLTVSSSKGCVRKCTFCDIANFWPKFIFRDPEKVANEIIYNYQKTGIKTFRFTDNLMNGSITNYRRMNEILASKIPGEIKYGGYAIFRGKASMPEDDFKLAKKAGCIRWSVGVESGSEKIRYEMKKKFDNDDLDWSVTQLLKNDIHQSWLLIVGYPSETEEDFLETIKLLDRYKKWARMKKISIGITPTFHILNYTPVIEDKKIAHYLGIDHIETSNSIDAKFWTSTTFTDNDYPTRSRRWKQIMKSAEEFGYSFGQGMTIQKTWEEIISADKLYDEYSRKIIPIRPS
jgi:hypothetical protein